MKRVFICLIIGLCLWNPISFVHAEGSILEITTDQEAFTVNDTVRTYITAKDIDQVAGMDIRLHYDPSKLRLISKEINALEDGYIDMQEHINTIGDQEGSVRIVVGLKKDTQLLSGQEQLLATLTFEAIGIGSTEMTLSQESRLVEEITTGDNVDYQYSDALSYVSKSIVINEEIVLAKVGGSVTLSDNGDAATTEVILLQEDTEIGRASVEAEGNYLFTGLEAGSYTLKVNKPGYGEYAQTIVVADGEDALNDIHLMRIKEDVNRDGVIDIEDLVMVGARYGIAKNEEDWLGDADLNQDEIIDLLDILYISRVLE